MAKFIAASMFALLGILATTPATEAKMWFTVVSPDTAEYLCEQYPKGHEKAGEYVNYFFETAPNGSVKMVFGSTPQVRLCKMVSDFPAL